MSNYKTLDPDRLAMIFQALANPHRVRIYQQLLECCSDTGCSGSPCEVVIDLRVTVGDVREDLEIAASTVSHHLKELRQSGLIRMGRSGRSVCISADPALARELAGFFSLSESKPKKRSPAK